MKITFSSQASEDYLHWQQTDKKILKRVNELIKAISLDPFAGSGKPEPLRHGLSGYWSRRINDEQLPCVVDGVGKPSARPFRGIIRHQKYPKW